MKDKGFAKAVDRLNLEATRKTLGVPFTDHEYILVQGLVEHEKRLNADDFSI